MMKIALCSDLHLEFGDIILKNDECADVLVLAGDIMIAQDLHDHPEPMNPIECSMMANGQGLGRNQLKAQRYRDFLKRCSFQFPHVIMIAGNHEFYNGKWIGNLNDLRNVCSVFSNVYFLEDEIKIIDDVTFIGTTLWTNMNKGDPLTLSATCDMMNDFRIIRHDGEEYRRLRPSDTVVRHNNSMGYIRIITEGKFDDKFVMVGHHAPSFNSIHEQYRNDFLMNGAFASDLSEFILDHPQIKVWVHGHTHVPFDYMIGETRVICNPRGYAGHEASADNFRLQYFEV